MEPQKILVVEPLRQRDRHPRANANHVDVLDGRQFGDATAESRLTLKAKAPVWVRIEDSNGNVVMTQMLMKGDTYRVPNRDGLVVIARDGGLLVYVIDGKEKGILGTPGEILVGRSLDITSWGARTIEAIVPADVPRGFATIHSR